MSKLIRSLIATTLALSATAVSAATNIPLRAGVGPTSRPDLYFFDTSIGLNITVPGNPEDYKFGQLVTFGINDLLDFSVFSTFNLRETSLSQSFQAGYNYGLADLTAFTITIEGNGTANFTPRVLDVALMTRTTPPERTTRGLLPDLAIGIMNRNRGQFTSSDGEVYGTISVFAVPEPSTWAMLIAGFALTGVAVRRRRGLCRLGTA